MADSSVNIPPPPDGFSIDSQQTPPAQQASPSAPPEGFTIDQPTETEPALKPEEKPVINVGGQAFDLAAHAAKTGIKYIGSAVQTGADWLNSLGIPTHPEAVARVTKNIEDNFDEFSKKSLKFYGHKDEDYPVTGAVGDAAGQLLVYAATGPAFTETAFGKAAMKLGPVFGRMVQGAAQGAAIEGLTAKGDERFQAAVAGAFGGAVGGGVGGAVGATGVRAGNAIRIKQLQKTLSQGAMNWSEDGKELAQAFQAKLVNVNDNTQKLVDLAQKALLKDGIVMKDVTSGDIPSGASRSTVEAVKMVRKYVEDTDYLRSNIFKKLAQVGKKESGGSYFQANESVLKAITGEDKELSQRVWKAFSLKDRVLLQKGIMYQVLQNASKGGHYDSTKIKDLLDTEGVKQFFPGSKGKQLIEGFKNIVDESNNHGFSAHPLAVSHLSWGLLGGAIGYEKGEGDWESTAAGAVGGFASYFLTMAMIRGAMGSQFGRNLIAAASHVSPGTPQAARIFDRLTSIGMISTVAPFTADEMTFKSPQKQNGASSYTPPTQ